MKADDSLSDPSNNLEEVVLDTLLKDGVIEDTWDFAVGLSVDHQQLLGVVKSLSADFFVVEHPISKTFWALTAEGVDTASHGAPEIRVLRAIPAAGEYRCGEEYLRWLESV